MNEFNRMRWKCRRGMLELDLILKAFLEKKYRSLSSAQRLRFNRLLDEPDPVLYKWLMGSTIPEDKELADMIKLIKEDI